MLTIQFSEDERCVIERALLKYDPQYGQSAAEIANANRERVLAKEVAERIRVTAYERP